jgi:VanZ family protein
MRSTQEHASEGPDRTGLWLGAYLLFVVYGSLVPLDYTALPFDVAWQRFSNAPFLELGVESRADWVANGVLYAPLGLLATLVVHRALHAPWWVSSLVAWLACVGVAFAVELAQVYFPPRTVSRNDLLAEAIGSAIGALAAPWFGAWRDRVRRAFRERSGSFVVLALQGYLLLYLAFCFFPYDVLVSTTELRSKAQSGNWGWVFAPSDRNALIVSLKLFVETLLSVPVGVLLARMRPRVRPLSAALTGLTLGLVIELGQFLIASGVSQGASVLARVAGVVLGAALPLRLPDDGLSELRLRARRLTWPILLAWFPLLAFVNGLLTRPWRGWDAAASVWGSLRLMPFYYHYYTSEAIALFSLASVSLMYLPLAFVGWANRLGERATLVIVAVTAAAVEACKLFVDGLRPDPTNVLIAAAAAWVALRALARVGAQGEGAQPGSNAIPVTASTTTASWVGAGTLVTPVAIAWASAFPSHRLLLVGVLTLCAIVVWRLPVLALAIIPAALPMLDLAPWTGRFFLDEFDLLQAVCLSLALQRIPANPARPNRLPVVLLSAVALSVVVGALRALLPLTALDANSFYSYYSPFNALRILKGAGWAFAFVVLWHRVRNPGVARDTFAAGIAIGLAWTAAWVVWERATFAGLFNFSSDFRVSGPFSAMHRGGAYLECFLAVASAFVLGALLRWRGVVLRALLVCLLAGASYATMVTFSRAGYVAFAAALLLTAVTSVLSGQRADARVRRAALAVSALVVAAAVALPVLGGSFARERLAGSSRDLASRQAHWEDALAMRDGDALARFLGEGLGRFPATHFWRTREDVRAASYGVVREGDLTFLRLAPGATLYVEQLLHDFPEGAAIVELKLRSQSVNPEISFSLCRKWLLTSLSCASATSRGPAESGAWRQVRATIDTARLADRRLLPSAPVSFSLFTPNGKSAIDVASLRVLDPTGKELLANGDFAQGLDRWFFTTDVSPPWTIDSLPVNVLFDMGWLGVLAWAALIFGTLGVGARALWRGEAAIPEAWAAFVAFLACATLNTLVDAPRFLWMFLVLAWLAMLGTTAARAHTAEVVGREAKDGRVRRRRSREVSPVA